MRERNFLDQNLHDLFTSEVTEAAQQRRLDAGPLLRHINQTHAALQGLEVVLRIAVNAGCQADLHEPENPDSEVPLSPATVHGLLALGQVAAGTLLESAERLAGWAEKHGTQGEQR